MELARPVGNHPARGAGCASNNSTKATPCLCADIMGDWREEILFRTLDSRELRIYTTTIPTEHRLYTLMHDPIYRISVALQNVGYNQPAQPGFYLGDGMKRRPGPRSGPALFRGDQSRHRRETEPTTIILAQYYPGVEKSGTRRLFSAS